MRDALTARVTIIAPLLAFAGRFVGKIVEMAFGWATVMLFGRVPDSKRLLLSVVALASVAWMAMVVASLIPAVGDLVVRGVPAPDFVRDEWLRWAMLALALLLPLAIGTAGLILTAAGERPSGARGIVVQVLRGYPYAAVLAMVLAFLLVVAPVRKLRAILKRWEDAHIAVIVKPGGYERVASDLESALDDAGLPISRAAAPRVLELPSRLLAAVGGGSVRQLVPDRVIVLKNPRLEVTIYPSDVALAGAKAQVAAARAAVASRLTFTSAYQTASLEAQQIEERLERIAMAGGLPWQALAEVDGQLAGLVVPYDDWSVLYRQRLQVELTLLRREERDGNGGFDPLRLVGDLVGGLFRRLTA
jgi:hypothetical protein